MVDFSWFFRKELTIFLGLLSTLSYADTERQFCIEDGPCFQRSCLEEISTLPNPESLLSTAIGKTKEIIDQCKQDYPELSPYLDKWSEKLKDPKIHCVYRDDQTFAAHAKDGEIFFRNYTLQNSLVSLKDQRESYPFSNVFIHEVLHLSDGDNQRARLHNRREQRTYQWPFVELNKRISNLTQNCPSRKMERQCRKEDVGSDRVSVITAACTLRSIFYRSASMYAQEGVTYLKQDKHFKILESLVGRMNTCGFSSCVELFTENSLMRRNSIRLDQEKAERLCGKLYENFSYAKWTTQCTNPEARYSIIMSLYQSENGDLAKPHIQRLQNNCERIGSRRISKNVPRLPFVNSIEGCFSAD